MYIKESFFFEMSAWKEIICCYEIVLHKILYLKIHFLDVTSREINLNTNWQIYHGWLEHHGPCRNRNTRPSFSNTRPNFWFCLSLQKFGRLFERLIRELKARPSILFNRILKILSAKGTIYSSESNLSNAINVPFTSNTWNYSLRHYTSYIPVGYILYLCKIIELKFNDRFRSWKQICEALLRVQNFR